MFNDGKPFDTNVFFSGGAGMFIQYHDVVKPVYLYAIVKMIITGESFGLPIDIIKDMSIFSIIEWYIKRRYKNPIRCLDFMNICDPSELDLLLQEILLSDDSIYKYSPALNIQQMFQVYRRDHMMFPVYIYSETEEPYIKIDCDSIFQGIRHQYVYGDLETAIKKCNQNFTYIFSDIELVKKATEILTGTCSHVLLTREYRYNYVDNCKKFKYDIKQLGLEHPYVRMGTTLAITPYQVARSFMNLQGGNT